jgi:DNA repair ATPase RecN
LSISLPESIIASSGISPLAITPSSPLQETLALPYGARFYRCAFQVNPFSYVQRHPKPGSASYTSEAEYNDAIIKALLAAKIEAIAVTDHYRVDGSASLIEAARSAGLIVFPGFEAVSADSVHLLCLFDSDTPHATLERFIGACGITDQTDSHPSPNGTKYALDLIECAAKDWNSIVIAAHIASNGGVLYEIGKQHRANVWKSPHLLAGSLPGPVDQAPTNVVPILKNQNPDYKRERPLAIVNAQDISSPEDVSRPGAWCWVKMADVSIEGLRQAFLDPESRIRLQTDPVPGDHAEFVAITWQGGDFHFQNGTSIHFNRDLNVLVGGRGTGKSTIIESIRYVLGLEPKGDEAKKAHEGVIKSVLKSGTKISLLVRSYRPDKHHYTIERTIPNPPVVKDENGDILSLSPLDVVPQAEVFGQHEISELTKDGAKLTRLLEKFVPREGQRIERKQELRQQLERSRSQIVDVKTQLQQTVEKLGTLPGLEDKLKRYQEAGLEDKLKDQSLIVKEEGLLKEIKTRLTPLREAEEGLRNALPVDTLFLSPDSLVDLPGAPTLSKAVPIFEQLNTAMLGHVEGIAQTIAQAEQAFIEVDTEWGQRKQSVQEAYEAILRELQQAKIDGEEFIRLRKQIEDLRPLKEKETSLQVTLKTLEINRRKLIDAWEEMKRSEYQAISDAAGKVSKELKERVRVKVQYAGDIRPLISLLREELGGATMNATNQQRLQDREDISLSAFAQACRDGKDALVQGYSLTPSAAEKIIQSGESLFMRIEELELPSTTRIELNVSPSGVDPEWKALDELSTGQKATAVLLLLLLDSEAPLVVDQPEDDLDNRFIADGVVRIMRDKKRQRQFIFSTHNANIPVLGDAELIVGLQVRDGKGEIPLEHMGAIDNKSVRHLVGEVLEGGQAAFELRRLKYGY